MIAATLLLLSIVVPHQEEDGESRTEELVDSRVMILSSETVIRQGDEPVIDTSSEPEREVVSLRTDVLFAFGSADLSPQADAVIDEAVRQIQARDATRLVITGHTDSIGSDSANQTLSEARSATVDGAIKAKLGGGGLPSDVSGRGETQPVAPNELPDGSDNPAGRALNRRVEVEVVS